MFRPQSSAIIRLYIKENYQLIVFFYIQPDDGRILWPKHVVEFTSSKTNTPSNTKLCLTSYCIHFTFDSRFKIRSANLHLVKGKGKSKVHPITGHEGPEEE